MITKFNFKTPGREDTVEEVQLYTRSDVSGRNAKEEKSAIIVTGLGEVANIVEIDNCATRLRVTVVDGDLVDEELLKISGAKGVMRSGNGVQVIYGPSVTIIKSNLDDFLGIE